MATRCVKVTNAPSAWVDVLRTVIRGGAVKETMPLIELVTGIELGTRSVDSGELVIVVNTVDVFDGRTTAILVGVRLVLVGGAVFPPGGFPELPLPGLVAV